jgi:lysine 6-dehydrogenase
MKILVFGGSGKMGSAVAWDLVKQEDVEVVGLVDRAQDSLTRVRDWVGSEKIRLHELDIHDVAALADVMAAYDVGVSTLPDRKTSYRAAETAVKQGMHFVDILEEYHRRPDAYEVEGLELPNGMTLNEYGDFLHETALQNEVTFLDGIGFAPGISNVMVGHAIRQLDTAEIAIARVGGIPSRVSAAGHPLRYMITWAFDHVLREYMVKVNVIKDGKVVEVDAAGERERFQFRQFGVDEALECAITPGMPSFIYTRPQLKEFAEKTVRWPGHWEGVQTLKECGLLDLDPVRLNGTSIVPRELLLTLIEPRLQPRDGDTDVCVMWNTVVGTKDGKRTEIHSYLWDEADIESGISSMARVTGFSAAIGAAFVGRGMIKERGIVPPEDGFEGEIYNRFLEELDKRAIKILEEVRSDQQE